MGFAQDFNRKDVIARRNVLRCAREGQAVVGKAASFRTVVSIRRSVRKGIESKSPTSTSGIFGTIHTSCQSDRGFTHGDVFCLIDRTSASTRQAQFRKCVPRKCNFSAGLNELLRRSIKDFQQNYLRCWDSRFQRHHAPSFLSYKPMSGLTGNVDKPHQAL